MAFEGLSQKLSSALSKLTGRGKLTEQRQELMNARFKHAAAQLEKTSELKAMRKQVARIETVLNEKEQRA